MEVKSSLSPPSLFTSYADWPSEPAFLLSSARVLPLGNSDPCRERERERARKRMPPHFLRPSFQDGNGTIENEELRGFLKDLLELVKKVSDAISYRLISELSVRTTNDKSFSLRTMTPTTWSTSRTRS